MTETDRLIWGIVGVCILLYLVIREAVASGIRKAIRTAHRLEEEREDLRRRWGSE